MKSASPRMPTSLAFSWRCGRWRHFSGSRVVAVPSCLNSLAAQPWEGLGATLIAPELSIDRLSALTKDAGTWAEADGAAGLTVTGWHTDAYVVSAVGVTTLEGKEEGSRGFRGRPQGARPHGPKGYRHLQGRGAADRVCPGGPVGGGWQSLFGGRRSGRLFLERVLQVSRIADLYRESWLSGYLPLIFRRVRGAVSRHTPALALTSH